MDAVEILKEVFSEALAECSPENLLPPLISVSDKGIRIAGHVFPSQSIHILGSGKAAVSSADTIAKLLGDRVAGGLVVSPWEAPPLDSRLQHLSSDHPIPSHRSQMAGGEMRHRMENLQPNDHFVYLLSGGSSALLELPTAPLTIGDVAEVNRQLLQSGLPIEDVNYVRVHMSELKGGGLASATCATGIVLVMSDVLDDPIPVIGSGPFTPVTRDYPRCLKLLEDRGLMNRLSAPVRSFFRDQTTEMVTQHTAAYPHVVFANNWTFLQAARNLLESRQIRTVIVSDHLTGEAQNMGKQLAELALDIRKSERDHQPMCLLFGGECTVTVKGNGIGGRCQELCLAALETLRDTPGITLLAAGTDGRDGITEAAGAIVDYRTWEASSQGNLNIRSFLNENDSFHFFETAGGLVPEQRTGVNLQDVVFILISV